VSQKWRNWYQNEFDEEIKGVDCGNTTYVPQYPITAHVAKHSLSAQSEFDYRF